MKLILTAFFCCLLVLSAKSDNRIRLEAKVNGKQVVLAFDTGCEWPVLFEQTVKSLGLSRTTPPADTALTPGKVSMGITEPFRFEYGDYKTTCQFGVFKIPSYIPSDIDGVLPWSFLSDNIIHLNSHEHKMTILEDLPDSIENWSQWKLKTDARQLHFEINNTGTTARILIDTGADVGVKLSEHLWEFWETHNQSNSTSLRAGYSPYAGLQVHEIHWTEMLEIGNFSISHVPVSLCDSDLHLQYNDYQATLGLYALSRFEIILDGKNDLMYTRPVHKRPKEYSHNRIAALFVPKDPAKTNDLLAHVVPNGIAYKAGIRDGDILLKIDKLDVTKWRTTPGILPLARFWSKPHGTKLNLELKRGGSPFEVTVVLQDILPPKEELGQPEH